MKRPLITAGAMAGLVVASPANPARAAQAQPTAEAEETRIPVDGASLYSRVIGRRQPAIVLHGGPDFDHRYLLPELDRLADDFRLIYYDQRGRGYSTNGVRPEDVTLTSDIDDLERVRQYYRLDAPVLLGHSWGTVLALEYALRYPTHVSRLVLMNPAPAAATDLAILHEAYLEALGTDMDRQRQIVAGAAYRAGDPEAVAARYRIHFEHALGRPEDYETLMARMKAAFVEQGKDGILMARAVEVRLMQDTWQATGYDLMPKLGTLRIPTLVITGDHDFIPRDISEHIAHAIPDARLVVLKDCGHFSYLECGVELRHALDEFFQRKTSRPGKH